MSSETIATRREPALIRPAALAAALERGALGAILVLATVLNFVQLNRVGLGNTYYAAAVRSMLTSWHNFFFVSLDPGGFVSIDKPPLAFWLQAASARLFGFGGLSLLLPEALAGVLSVALLYHLVARAFGRPAGLLAALALALTPVAVLVDRSNLVESILVLTVLLAAWAVMRAAEAGKLGWLLLGMAVLGLGFNVKMLEAYLALPALVLLYLLGAPVRWSTRIWHLVLACVVLLVVSFSWIAAVDLTPASQRPYVGSSGNNSELSLALGYNGLGRLTGNTFSFLRGGTSLSQAVSELSPTNLGFTQGETGGTGIQRLVNAELGGQASWLLVLAILGWAAASWQRAVRFPLDLRQQSLVLWGTWLLTGGAFFSVAGFFHAYYLAMVAPPVAALAGIGLITLWRDYRRPGWRGFALPLALLATAAVQAHILSYYPDWSRWLTPLVVGSSVVAALVLLLGRLHWTVNHAAWAAAALGAIALLFAPSVWTEYSVAHASGNGVPSAGPAGRGGFGGGRPPFAGARGAGFFGRTGRSGRGGFGFPRGGRAFAGGFGPDDAAVNKNLVRYLEARQGRTRFLVAALNAAAAEPFILQTGKPVMDLGGFMGADRIVDPSQLSHLVLNGSVRYFLLSSAGRDRFPRVPEQIRRYLEQYGGFGRGVRGGFRGGFGARNSNNDLVQWVSAHCAAVPARAYLSVSTPSGPGGGQQLYDCGAYAAHPAT